MKGRRPLASKKLTFDFGQPPNFDGLAEQKLIAHSVNVESLADGSGVRTRSGMRHAYPFRVYSDQTSETTQIMSGLRTPNVGNVSGNEVGLDLIYSVDADGKYIIKDMKQTTFIQMEDQYVTFTHVTDQILEDPQILIYSDDNVNYYLVLNRLSGSKNVVVDYRIGLIKTEGETVSYNRSLFCYNKYPNYQNTNNDNIIKGTLILNTMMGEFIKSIDTYSIVGSATLDIKDSFVKIPIALAQYEGSDDGMYFGTEYLPIELTFTCYGSNGFPTIDFVKTTDLKYYIVLLSNTTNSPVVGTFPNGQSGMVSFKYKYPRDFFGTVGGGA